MNKMRLKRWLSRKPIVCSNWPVDFQPAKIIPQDNKTGPDQTLIKK
jgi:hypothetical protein